MSKQEDTLNEFAELVKNMGKAHVKVQSVWVTVTEVDWNEKTMTAKGLTDDLEYFNISLGLGSYYRKPKNGTTCLVGLIENQEAACFLIDAEEIEELSLEAEGSTLLVSKDGWQFNGGKNGGLVNWPKLLPEMNKTNAVINAMIAVFQSWVPVPSDGGAALKTAMITALQAVQVGNYANLEDTKVKH